MDQLLVYLATHILPFVIYPQSVFMLRALYPHYDLANCPSQIDSHNLSNIGISQINPYKRKTTVEYRGKIRLTTYNQSGVTGEEIGQATITPSLPGISFDQ